MPAALVSVAELMAGFLAASIPTYRPVWAHIFSKNSSKYTSDDFKRTSGGEPRPWEDTKNLQTEITTGNTGMSATWNVNNPGRIAVTRDIELSTKKMGRGFQNSVWTRVSDDGSLDRDPYLQS